jgi:hypothetical protein
MDAMITPQKIYQELLELPDDSLVEIWQFIEFVRFKSCHVPQQVVKLGGLLRDYAIDVTEEDIAQARKEMWSHLGDLNE